MTAPTTTAPPEQRLTAGQIAAIIALIEAQSRLREQLTSTAVAAALAPFTAFTGWYSTAQIRKAVTEVLRVVQPTQRNAARLTDAYLARVATVMTGRTVRPSGNVDITRLRRAIPDRVRRKLDDGDIEPAYIELGTTRGGPGPNINAPWTPQVHGTRTVDDPPDDREWANPGDPYGRVADMYRYDTEVRGQTETQARERALVRLQIAARNDVTLAVREQYRRSIGFLPGVTGYRRVLRPELSESGPCGLCVVAADRVYRVQDLLPLHARCVCEVLPVIGDQDPGFSLNSDDLRQVYRAAGGTSRAALREVRVALAEHGELGPVLVDADDNFRGPRQVARRRQEYSSRREMLEARLRAYEDRYAQLQQRASLGQNVERALERQARQIEQAERDLAGA